MPDFVGLVMRTILRGSNPSLPTNKGLQDTADPFVLPGKARVYWADADLPAKRIIIKTLYKPVYKPNKLVKIWFKL